MTDYLRLAQERAPQSEAERDNPYLPLARQAQEMGQNRARTVLEMALKDDPDLAAERLRLSQTSGVPLRVVERNLEELRVKERARAVDLVSMAQESPVLYRQLVDPTFATTSVDDLDTLKNLEQSVRKGVRYVVSADGKGLATDVMGAAQTVGLGAPVGVGKMAYDLAATVNDLIGWNAGAQGARNISKSLQGLMDRNGFQPETSTGQAIKSGLQSAGTNLALLPIGLYRGLYATASQAASTVAGLMAAGVGADAFNTAREKGKDKLQAGMYAIPQGLFEYVFERIPAAKLFGDLAANTGLMKTLGRQAVSEGWTEQVTTLAQDFNEWMNLNPEKTLAEFIKERPEAAYQTFIATLVGVGVQTSAIKGVEKVLQKATDTNVKFDQDLLESQMKLASQSMLRQRSPEQFRAHVQRVVDDNDGTKKEIYVDAEVLNQLPQELLAQLPESVREQIPDALDTRSAVAIPMADVLTVAPGTELEQILNDNARMTPDAVSRVEAQMADQFLRQEAERVLQQAADQEAWQQSSEVVKTTILDQLNTAGRFTADVNEAYSTLVRDFYSVTANRVGMTPEELYARYPLRVGALPVGQGAVLDQGVQFDFSIPEDGNQLRDVKVGGTTITLSVKGRYFNPEGVVDVASVRTPAAKRGRGSARAALQALVNQADAQGVALRLDASPLDKKTNSAKLVAFYESLGFERTGRSNNAVGDPEMVRKPKAINQSANYTADTITVDGKERPTRNSNGQPIAQTEQGLVNFWRWFGDSRVVDAEGRPLVVYHGTTADVEQFDLAFSGSDGVGYDVPAVFATTDQKLASDYALNKFDREIADAMRAMQRFKNENPGVYGDEYERLYKSVKDAFANQKADPRPETGGGANVVPLYMRGDMDVVDANGQRFMAVMPKALPQAVANGKDGVIVNDVIDNASPATDYPAQVFVTFDPTNVKSATGNRGTFDANDPNILNQAAGRGLEYQIEHKPMNVEGGASTLDDLTPAFGEDVYGDSALQFFGSGDPRERGVIRILKELRGKPDAMVTIYRGVPANANGINPGDWVTLSKDAAQDYADQHDGGKVVSLKVPASHVTSWADSLLEFGYFPPTQQLNQGPRGTFSPEKLLITLNENADLSTFLHESGHFFLEVMADLASQPNAPAEVQEDMAKVLAWFGIKGDEQVGGPDAGGELAQGGAAPYHRYTDGDADTGIGYMMFAEDQGSVANAYGPNHYTFDPADIGENATVYAGSRKFKELVREAFARHPDVLDSYQADADALAGEINPSDIVNSAQIWDAPDLVEIIRAEVLEPNGWLAVETDDGAIVFDRNAVKDGGTFAQGGDLPQDNTQPAGRTPLEVWNAMTLDQKRPYHERWAESFEQYLFEGKAPSQELQPLFRRFRSWLVNVYKSFEAFMRGRNLNLSDDIRKVFDRMLATDEQIAQAEASAGMLPDFDATNEAIEKLQARSLRDLRLTVNARNKTIKALQKEAAGLREGIAAEVRAEVEQQPVYRALTWLRKGETTDPETGDKIKAEKGYRLNTQALAEMYPEGMLARPDLAKLKGMTAKEGLHPDMVADMFGFESGDQLVRAILDAEPIASVVEGMTDQRMLERHGDLSSPEAIEAAANEAVHNDARARSLATELKAQAEMIGQRQDTGRTATNGRPITVNALEKAAKEFAANLAARRRIKDLKNAARQHRAAEARAGKAWQNATAKGETQAAVQAKRDQVLNNATVKALQEAQAEVKKIIEFFKRVTKGSDEKVVERGRDPDVVNAMRAILAAYDVAPRLEKSALAYMETVGRNDPAMYAALKPSVDAAMLNAKPLTEMTVEELRGLTDELRAMWELAKRSRQMEVDGNLLDIQDAADELMARMGEIGIPDQVPGEKGAITNREEAGLKLQFAKSILSRVEQWAERLDGKFGGPFLRLVFQPVKDAADRYRTDKVTYRKRFTALLESVAPSLPPGAIEATEIGYTFGNARDSGAAELLHAILHTGNNSNKRKLLLGRGWATENADGTLDTSKWDAFITRMHVEGKLNKAHYDFAQGVWDLLEEMKPLAQETHRRVYGRYFAEVTADAVATPFGTYRGGYVPAQTDSRLVKDAKLRELAEGENESMAYAFPAAPSGFTKARVEYNKPLLLDLRALAQHMDKVLLFSHMQGAVTDVRRLLTNKQVSYALDRIDPGAYEGMLIPWLNRAARQVVETPVVGDRKLSRFLSAARSRAGMALMFANVSNTMQQITGFSLAAVKVRPGLMLSATAQFTANPKAMRESVAGASPYMQDRMLNEVGAMNDAVESILVNPSLLEKSQAWTQRHAYFMQAAVDNTMSPIIWTAAYNQAIEEGSTSKDAVRFADGVVRQTQGSTLPEDVSRFETGPGYARLFTQFVSYFNMMANTNATALKQVVDEMGVRKGAGKLLYIALAGLLVPIWVAEAIAHAFRGGPEDDDKDGWLDDWLLAVFGVGTLRGMVAQVPIVGQAVQLVVNRFNDNPADDKFSLSPAVSLIESAVSSPASVYKAIVDDGNAQKAVRDVAAAATLLTGLPIYAAARPIGYATGVADRRIEPTGPVDLARGLVTGTASPESKQR